VTNDRVVSLGQWRAALHRECDRRQELQRALTGNAEDPREQLIAQLDLIAERLRANPDFREPSPDEQAQSLAKITAWFVEHGYMRGR
jgi:hypothetical protein